MRAHPLVADALLAVAVFVLVVFARDPDAGTWAALPGFVLVVAALTCMALVFRRRHPIAVLALTMVGSVTAILLVGGRAALALSCLVAVYTVAVRSDRRTAFLAWLCTAVALTLGSLVATEMSAFDPDVFSFVAWTGLAAAFGDALRNRRAYVIAIEERAERAERTRGEEARRQVAEERLRIARELHDVVAHRIAVVNVQAGVASHLLTSQPAAAEEALGHVRAASRAVLDELSDILNVLRQPGEPADPRAPAPSLAEVDALVESFAAAGLAIDWSLTGRPRDVGPHVDMVAYRVLEEALTNAHKHGTGKAHASVGYTPSGVALVVTNPMKRPDSARALPSAVGQGIDTDAGSRTTEVGHGLMGMRERAAAVGGVLRAAPAPDGEFRVEAVLPVNGSSAA